MINFHQRRKDPTPAALTPRVKIPMFVFVRIFLYLLIVLKKKKKFGL